MSVIRVRTWNWSTCSVNTIDWKAKAKASFIISWRVTKLLHLHAGFSDAFRFMKRQYNFGPHSFLILWDNQPFRNNCLLGHVTGVTSWIRFKSCESDFHKKTFYFKRKEYQVSFSLAISPTLSNTVLNRLENAELHIRQNYWNQ